MSDARPCLVESVHDERERRLGDINLRHLAQALAISSTETQRANEPLAQLAQRDAGHVVVLEQVDHEPLRCGASGKDTRRSRNSRLSSRSSPLRRVL